MKDILKQFTALLLIMDMCLSLLSAGALATGSSLTGDESLGTQSSTLAEVDDVSVEPSVDADSMSDASSTDETVDDFREEQPVLDAGIRLEEADYEEEEADSTEAIATYGGEDNQDHNEKEQKISDNHINQQNSQSLSTMMGNTEIGKVHNLVICGSKDARDGYSDIKKVLKKNALPYWRNDEEVVTLKYDEDNGTTEDTVFDTIKRAFNSSKENDLNILYYGGHTTRLDENRPETAEMAIHFIKDKKNELYSDKSIAVETLFNELEKYEGNYILILDTCYANAYNVFGLKKLDSDKQNRYTLLMAESEYSTTAKVFIDNMGVMTKTILQGVGYRDDYTTMDADSDSNGQVTSQELFDYLCEKMVIPFRWNPHLAGGANRNIPLFQLACTKIIDKKTIPVEWCIGEKKKLKAEAERDGGLKRTILWKSSAPEIASVDKSGNVSFLSEGEVTIASYLQDKNGNDLLGSESEITFQVVKPTITVSPTTLTLYEKETKSLTAKVEGTTKSVKWKSSDKKTATVDKKGNVTGKKAGSCIISAYLGDVEAGCMINVKEPTIKLNKESLTLDLDNSKKKSYTLKATVEGPSKKVTWKSSNKKIATVDKNGKVTAKKSGSCTITAKANGVSAKCKVTVKSKKDKAFDCYNDLLSGYSDGYRFALAYIDKDDIPDLILQNSSSKKTAVYSYVKGSALYRESDVEEEGYYYYDWLNVRSSLKYYKKKGMITYKSTTGNLTYERFSKGTAELYLEWGIEDGEGMSYGIYGLEPMSKSRLKKEIKKRVGSTKASKPSFHKNTKGNRKKYLK